MIYTIYIYTNKKYICIYITYNIYEIYIYIKEYKNSSNKLWVLFL